MESLSVQNDVMCNGYPKMQVSYIYTACFFMYIKYFVRILNMYTIFKIFSPLQNFMFYFICLVSSVYLWLLAISVVLQCVLCSILVLSSDIYILCVDSCILVLFDLRMDICPNCANWQVKLRVSVVNMWSI